jgi:2'-5' RNA ligase
MADAGRAGRLRADDDRADADESNPRWRLFVGLPPDAKARAEITTRLAAIQAHGGHARWVPAENVHVTLLFLGSRDQADVATISRSLDEVASRHARYRLGLGGPGTFGGGRRGRTLWLRVERGANETAGLVRDLERALGGDPENAGREIRPHLTLARDAEREVVERARATLSGQPGIGWTVDRVHLYRSRVGHGPPVYEELAALPLGRRSGAA